MAAQKMVTGSHRSLMLVVPLTWTWYRNQGSVYRIQGAGCRVQGSGFRVQGLGRRVQGLEFHIQGCSDLDGRLPVDAELDLPGFGPSPERVSLQPRERHLPERHPSFKVQGSGFRVQGSGYRVQGSGFRVRDSGFRVQGARFRLEVLYSQPTDPLRDGFRGPALRHGSYNPRFPDSLVSYLRKVVAQEVDVGDELQEHRVGPPREGVVLPHLLVRELRQDLCRVPA